MNSIIKLYGMANWSIFADRALNSLHLIADIPAKNRNSDYEALVCAVTEGLEKKPMSLLKIPPLFDLNDPNEVKIVTVLADLLVEIPIQRTISYLIMCYSLSYFKMPLIFIRHDEREGFLSAFEDKFKMRAFLSEKIREAVFLDGRLLEKVGGKYGSERYQYFGSSSQKKIVIEWHELLDATRQWKLSQNKGE